MTRPRAPRSPSSFSGSPSFSSSSSSSSSPQRSEMGTTPTRTGEEIAELKVEQGKTLTSFAAIDEKYRRIAYEVRREEGEEEGEKGKGEKNVERNITLILFF